MDAAVVLGKQPPGTRPVLLSAHGAPPPGVLRQQTPPGFPRPGRRVNAILFAVIVLLTAATAIAIGAAGEPAAMWAALMVPILLGLCVVFLGPMVRVARDRSGKHSATGTVILTDHAGLVHGEDAQQRALIHVEQAGEVCWLAASQSGLRLAEGDEVQLSWASKRPESCYVHGVLAHR